MKKKERVVVAMSGGVDSSVAAALLQKEGYEVIGITMCFNLMDVESKKPRCCGLQGIEDARRVAHKLGIKHYVINMQKQLEEKVVKEFLQEYTKGRTPNPCVTCNQFIKFDALLNKALSLGATYLATGHYVRITKTKEGLFLRKSKDLKKDQSYFLCRLTQKQLKHLLFPLGRYVKSEVRDLARKFSLPVAEKAESQEICFLPGSNYRDFLVGRLKASKDKAIINQIKPGLVVDKTGKILGKHKGVAFYTIGQREGLGIAFGSPIYVKEIDVENNKIIVGSQDEVRSKEFLVKDVIFAAQPIGHKAMVGYYKAKAIKNDVALKVKIRYNHKEAPAEVTPFKKFLKVRFKTPQFAVTPGQSAVFYKNNNVIAGGIIDKVIDKC